MDGIMDGIWRMFMLLQLPDCGDGRYPKTHCHFGQKFVLRICTKPCWDKRYQGPCYMQYQVIFWILLIRSYLSLFRDNCTCVCVHACSWPHLCRATSNEKGTRGFRRMICDTSNQCGIRMHVCRMEPNINW